MRRFSSHRHTASPFRDVVANDATMRSQKIKEIEESPQLLKSFDFAPSHRSRQRAERRCGVTMRRKSPHRLAASSHRREFCVFSHIYRWVLVDFFYLLGTACHPRPARAPVDPSWRQVPPRVGTMKKPITLKPSAIHFFKQNQRGGGNC